MSEGNFLPLLVLLYNFTITPKVNTAITGFISKYEQNNDIV